MNAARRSAVVLAEDQYENLELHYPRLRLEEAGLSVRVAGPQEGGQYRSKEGYPVTADVAWGDVEPASLAALVVPGGYAPDRMRRHRECLRLVSDAWDAGAVVAAICHAGWVLASAGIVSGRRLTSFFAIRDDMENAGAEWVDEPCVVDGRLVTSRVPADLPRFTAEILRLTEAG